MTFIIETGIPIPNKARATGLVPALRSLDIGQSLVMEEKSYGSAVSWLKKKANMTFVRSSVGDGKCRVWRIE